MEKSLKSTALIFCLVGLILISGLITSKTLHTEPENPVTPNVNATSGEADVKTKDGDSTPGPREPVKSSGNPAVKVWVNTNSGVYHCPNTPWYGDTRNGQYMTQSEAQAKGYRPSHGIVCG